MTAVETQLVLVTPPIAAPEAFLPALEAALAGGPVAAVIARLATPDDRASVNVVKTLARLVQAKGCALMVEGAIDTVARGGADGLHLIFDEARVTEAIERLAPDRMVGVAGLKSRDDAMSAGEKGCDYVMFGEPMVSRHAEKNGVLPPFAAVVERVGWWAEVFQIPVVGFSPDIAGAGALAQVNADFVALGDAVWAHPDGPTKAVAAALAALRQGQAT
ncbi:thiamine phosphate synthase [Phreatobacter stygius]|uniref:Thiamine phosphate synthase n=1 Tax=Phreatobacter stygius TaxID=1940610 RepID=A0A4D7B892_9HYPH|nr:thiamine phosphate synthase [Phreatobacter stygius]